MNHKYLHFSRTILTAMGTCFLLFITSCGNDQKSNETPKETASAEQTGSSGMPEACGLLTEEDAKAILGGPVSKGMATASMCQYLSASEELSKTGESVSLTVHQNGASEYEKYLQDTERDMAVKPEPVTGVGDKAAWAEGSLIVAHKNDLLIILVGRRMEKAAHLEAARSLAQKIISRK